MYTSPTSGKTSIWAKQNATHTGGVSAIYGKIPYLVVARRAGAVLTGAGLAGVTTVLAARAVLVNVVLVHVVQVTVVQIIDVVTVLYGLVSAVRAMDVRVILVDDVGAHMGSFLLIYAITRIV